jgi:hypothetical protein
VLQSPSLTVSPFEATVTVSAAARAPEGIARSPHTIPAVTAAADTLDIRDLGIATGFIGNRA